ncbi:MAG: NADP-dependent oxidoreductase [Alphaproteobacteria bacterium]|nr:NADP-dependent oxidoreductase [Alphaproteobacteria bacterium]
MRNLQIQLARQPEGAPKVDDFRAAAADMPNVRPGTFLTRSIALSLDPYMRGAIAGRHMGHTRLNQGDVIYGRCVAEVMESKHAGYAAGDIVVLESGWQQFYLSDGGARDQVRKVVRRTDIPLSAHVGVLGMPGLTAFAGVEKLANPALGSTFVVTAAAGPVGGTAGQLAKAKGCRVVGIAGSDEKCRIVTAEYGFDACINYKHADWPARLKAGCPDGIDTYFDNVGGEVLDQIVTQLNLRGKVVMCGLMSQYNRIADGASHGHNLGTFVSKRAQLLGLVVYDYADKMTEFHKAAIPLMRAGRLSIREDRVEGLENAPALFVKLIAGDNTGKALVGIAPERA